MFSRAAPMAGREPPANPHSQEKPNQIDTVIGGTANEQANSENDPKFSVEIVKNWSSEAIPSPNRPPPSERTSDSIKNAIRMLRRKNPSARKVPISTVRLATAPYIVIIAPIVAPVLKITVMKIPRIRKNFALLSDCSSKNLFARLGTKYCSRLSVSNANATSERSSGFFSLRVTVDNEERLKASAI